MEQDAVVASPRGRLIRDFSADDDATKVAYAPGAFTRSPYGARGTSYQGQGVQNNQGQDVRIPQRQTSEARRPDSRSQTNGTSGALSPMLGIQDARNPDARNPDARDMDFNFELSTISERNSSYAASTNTRDTASQHTTFSASSSSKLADFFGSEVFQIVLHNPTTLHQLIKFSQTRFCGENLEFLDKVSWCAAMRDLN